MKTFLVFLLILISCSVVHKTQAQDEYKHIAKMTLDFERINGIKEVLSWDLMEVEKEGFAKAYDSVINLYISHFEGFYRDKYSKDEIRELLNFYKKPTGKKLCKDLGKFYQSNLLSPSLNERILKIKDNYRNGIFSSSFTSHSNKLDPDVLKLFQLISVNEYILALKKYEFSREVDQGLVSAFDIMSVEYLFDLGEYFQANLTSDDRKELLIFYETQLGKKVAKNSVALIQTTIKANDIWADDIKNLMKDINIGKFQHKN